MKHLICLTMLFLSGCNSAGDSWKDTAFDTNPFLGELLSKSRLVVETKSHLARSDLDRDFVPRYIELSDRVCVAWFPKVTQMRINTERTKVVCWNKNANVDGPPEYNAF